MPSARVLLLAVLAFGLFNCSVRAIDAPEPPASQNQIKTWVRELGHPDYKVRNAAVRELTRRPEARTAVREAAISARDPEIRSRSASILQAYYRIDRPRLVARIKQMAVSREADLLAESAVRYVGDEEPIWQALTDFGWAGMEMTRKEYGRLDEARTSSLPDRDFQEFQRGRELEVIFPRAGWADRGNYLFRGARLVLDRRASAPLVATTGPVDARGTSNSFWVVNGEVTLSGSVTGSVIVCDSGIEAGAAGRPRRASLRSSLIVARGNIRLPQRITDCVILAAGNVEIPEGATLVSTTIRSGGKITRPDDWYEEDVSLSEDLRGWATRPFAFFECHKVGLEVKAVDGGIQLVRIDENSPLMAAGARSGDVVTAVDRVRVDSAETFRRSLRSAYLSGQGTFHLKRDKSELAVLVRFTE